MFRAFRNRVSQVFSRETSSVAASADDDEFVEAEVCGEDEITEGSMRVVEVAEGRALLVKTEGQLHAVGTKCSHYGAPLSKGAVCSGRVRCPWHGACFNLSSGDIEDFPGLDPIPKFEVKVTGGKVKVRGRKSQLTSGRITRPSPCKTASDADVYLIVGGGGAAAACVETLRREGFQGRIVMATKESCLPYDRPKLSKALDTTPEAIALRKNDFYSSYCVEVLFNKEAVSVNTEQKEVSFQDGTSLSYTKVLFATGGRPRTLDIPGADLENIFLLRTPHDGNKIATVAAGQRVVVVGSSFIGLEVAGYLSDRAASVTVVGRSPVPLQHVLGDKLGVTMKKVLQDKGVEFVFSNPPVEFIGESGALTYVVLKDGTRLQADCCVLGVGVTPSTDYLTGTSVNMSNGYIVVDKGMKTSVQDVYAAGDIVKFPLFLASDELVNIQHWQMAAKQGQVAARSMMGRDSVIHSVPFFWCAICGKSLRFTGYSEGHDDVVIHGDLSDLKFVAFYTRGDWVIAVASMNFDPIVAQAAEMFHSGRPIKKDEIIETPDGWINRLYTK